MTLAKLIASVSLLTLVQAAALGGQQPVRYPVLRPNGRLQVDAAFYEEDKKDMSNGAEVRRARLGMAGDLTAKWSFQLEMEFADDDSEIRDVWLMYQATEQLRLQIGNFKESFSIEGITSARVTSFIERSLMDAFVPPRHYGVALRSNFARATATAGIYGQEPGDLGDAELQDSEGWGVALRGTFAPVLQERRLVHLGAAVRHRTPDAQEDDGTNLRFRGFSETHVDRTRFYDTGNLADNDHYQQLGLEGAVVFGPFSLQGEHMWTRLNRTALPNSTLSGGYVYASFFPAGEHRVYDPQDGEFLGVNPVSSKGALELLLRFSALDLNDGPVTGGSGQGWTAGANWYIGRNLRFMANYVITDHDALADANGAFAGDDDFSVLSFRAQFFF